MISPFGARTLYVGALVLVPLATANGQTPLMNASAIGDEDAVRSLLDAGVEVNAQDETGATALMRAAVGGHVPLVEMLLGAGADRLLKTAEGWTAMRYAITANMQDVVAHLRSPGRAPTETIPSENQPPHERGEAARVTTPEVLFQATPFYTDDARDEEIQGEVVVESIVRKDGTTDPIRVTQALRLDLDLRAIQAARRWKFKPATMDGEPVDVIVDIVINYNIL